MLAEGEIEQMLGIRTRSREINTLSDHTIICGYGRTGRMLAAELGELDKPLVVVDTDADRVDRAVSDGHLAMLGDCTEEETLQQAGIFRANVLATVVPHDACNVFITLTARGMSDSIRIIARAELPVTESKLIRSGANHVVIPAAIGAIRVAQLAINESGDAEQLPENRYRILGATRETARTGRPELGDVEQLAEMASDLTRTFAQRNVEQIIQEEHAVDSGSSDAAASDSVNASQG